MKKLFIFANKTKQSSDISKAFVEALGEGFEVCDEFSPDVDMVLVFGGDGAFLKAVDAAGYSDIPVLGINTGHLGFFQEFNPHDVDKVRDIILGGDFKLQPYRLLEVDLLAEGVHISEYALNDVCLRDKGVRVVNLTISVGDNFVEKFYGDGIIVASSAGSTAYNYSLGGAIVDPRLEALQLTPMAPINNLAYRSFTSSLLFPPQLEITITPQIAEGVNIGVWTDGKEIHTGFFDKMTVTLSDRVVNVVRGADYDFWTKVESKFL